MRLLLATCLLSFPVLAAQPQARPELELPSAAPMPQTEAAPPEAELSPPPDAESTSLPPADVIVHNPAFPLAQPPPPPKDLGPRYDADDLAPYFADGALAKAKADYDAGEFAQALADLHDVDDSTPARYLEALALTRAGQSEQAEPLWEQLVQDEPALADRCLMHAGLADEDLGKLAQAAALFEQVPAGSHLFPDAHFGLARVWRRAGKLDRARAALEPLTHVPAEVYGRDVAADALLTLADLAASAHDPRGERAWLIQLWSEHPITGPAAQAKKRLKNVPIPVDAEVARAEALIDANRNLPGLKVLKPLLPKLKLPDPLACRARFAYGKGLRKLREHTRAEKVLEPVVAQCRDPQLRPRALYVLGSSESIIAPAAGVKTYLALANDYPDHPFADDALFYAADLDEQLGADDDAVALLSKAAARYPAGDFASEALFRVFWIQREAGKLGDAVATLDRIEKQYADASETYDVERARYWRARVFEQQGKTADAIDGLAALAVAHPTTFYGLMARQHLARLDPKREAGLGVPAEIAQDSVPPWPLHAGALAKDPHFLAGVELLRLGFPDAASAELLSVDRSGLSAEASRVLVLALAQSGDERNAHQFARVALRRDLSGEVTEKTRAFWEIAYPDAFRDLVEKSCHEAGIDPDLLQGLMREESALDPRALSWAGALGLTQLMLPTARHVARRLHLRHVTQSKLLEPALNIRLGAHYLADLLHRFDDNPFYALASYNAGPGAVAAWNRAHPDLPIDEWVEEIPIAETRGYVKRVMRSYNTYRLLYPPKVDAPGKSDLTVR